jgi:hypothetical protein
MVGRQAQGRRLVGVCASAWLAAGTAIAQQEAPPAGPAPNPPSAAAPAPFQPGFIDAVGRWLEQGAAKLKSDVQGAQDKLGEKLDKLGKDAREGPKEGASGAVGLPNTRVLAGRERCAVAQNGAPDCEPAAQALCKGKGFKGGKSIDTQTERTCSPRVLLSGRPPTEAECPTEMFVTRAMCQ